jgi:hypothetical protein
MELSSVGEPQGVLKIGKKKDTRIPGFNRLPVCRQHNRSV